MQDQRRVWRAVLCALGLAAASAAPARDAGALTLADLDAGASFTVGSLTFADFDATVAGDLPLDLADYPVQLLPDGFRLSGPLSVLLGGTGTLLLSYSVSAPDPLVTGASLFASGTTIGTGSYAWVGESLLGPGSDPLGSLFVYQIEDVGGVASDAVSFAPVAQLAVAKTVSLGAADFAAIPVIDQRFVLVPETPATWLLTFGLVGLAWWRPRRVFAD